jgi:hypothetical protein
MRMPYRFSVRLAACSLAAMSALPEASFACAVPLSELSVRVVAKFDRAQLR